MALCPKSVWPLQSFHRRAGSRQKMDPAERFLLMPIPLRPPREERTGIPG